MSKIRITNILIPSVKENFEDNIKIKIDFDAYDILPNTLDWKIIYVGSANSCDYDQVLESFSFPVEQVGNCSFGVSVSPPNPKLIPSLEDLLGATLLMISVVYNGEEFFRCSYFVYNNFEDENYIQSLGNYIYI